MPTKTKIIFIVVFIIVGVSMIGGYLYFTRTVTENADGTKTTSYKNFNPFGTGGRNDTEVPVTDDTIVDNVTSQNQVGIVVASRFHKVTEVPISGAAFFKTVVATKKVESTVVPPIVAKGKTQGGPTASVTPATTSPVPEIPKEEVARTLRYIERITGHVYQTNLDTKTNNRVSNTTVPNIYESFFNDTGSMALYRYIASDNKTISTYSVTIGKETGDFLQSNISNISVSPKKDNFFYLVRTQKGSIGYIKNFIDPKNKAVFESPFSEWIAQYISDGKVYLTTKASVHRQGYLYALNTSVATINKIYGGIAGFTTLANIDGSFVAISDATSGNPQLKLLDVAKHSTNNLSVYGLPEKCVWSSDNINLYCAIPKDIPSGEYPDSWYQGLVSFDDRFVKINTSNFEITQLGESDTDSFDGTNLFLNDTDSQLFFTNKKDSLLWMLDLK